MIMCRMWQYPFVALHDILDAPAGALQDVALRADDGLSQVAQLVMH